MKTKTLLYHSLFWIGTYLLWVVIFRSYSIALSKTMTIEFCYLLFITADFYAINNFIAPQFLNKKEPGLFVTSIIIIILISAYLRALLAVQINHRFFHTLPIGFGALYVSSIINITFWVLLITTGKMIVDRIKTQQQFDQVEKERIKNELDYLKAQINPHALFNSLNTIYGHIDKSNQVARNILLQFSELLRYQLYDCGAEKVNLEKEIMYIKNYVGFQRLRKDENLILKVDIEEVEPGLKIAPLLLVVLIENAFKFVSNSSDKENRINIKTYTKNKVLYSSIVNTKDLQQDDVNNNSNGIGLANLKRRLELLYAEKYQLITKVEDDLYKANLIIDLA